jgi:dihydrofolate reductase
MAKVIAEQSISLDGFTTGPNAKVDNPLGDRGDRLHDWTDSSRVNAEVNQEPFKVSGAIAMGRRMFDMGVGPWGEDPPFHMPVFVVTHRASDPLVKAGGTTYFFVTGGIEDALARARAAAGDKDVAVFGGASLIRQFMEAGLLDELRIHLVPLLLGEGTRLFDGMTPDHIALERKSVIDVADVTHITFRVVHG